MFGDEELDGFVEFDGELLEDELFMSVPCDAGELDVSVVWPVEVFESVPELVELPTVPLEEPLTEPLPVCDVSTGPSAPDDPVVPLVEVSAPVDGAAGRTRSLPLVEPAVSPADEEELEEVLLSGLVVLELDEV